MTRSIRRYRNSLPYHTAAGVIGPTMLLLGCLLIYVSPAANMILEFGATLTVISLLLGVRLIIIGNLLGGLSALTPSLLAVLLPALHLTRDLAIGGFTFISMLLNNNHGSCDSRSLKGLHGSDVLGICRVLPELWSYDMNVVVYDSARELLLEPDMRSEPWRDAMMTLPHGRSLILKKFGVHHLSGNYFVIELTSTDVDQG